MFNSVMRYMALLQYGLQVDYSVHKWHFPLVCSRISSCCILKHKHMTLAISTLKKIFPLQNARLSSKVSQCATLNVIMYIIFCLKKLLTLMNGIKGYDTLRPLGIQFRPFATSVRGTKYHKQCTPTLGG